MARRCGVGPWFLWHRGTSIGSGSGGFATVDIYACKSTTVRLFCALLIKWIVVIEFLDGRKNQNRRISAEQSALFRIQQRQFLKQFPSVVHSFLQSQIQQSKGLTDRGS